MHTTTILHVIVGIIQYFSKETTGLTTRGLMMEAEPGSMSYLAMA